MILKLIGGLFVCLWAADFVTGMAHWLEDTYCLENYPLIGSFICEPNIEHHVDPQLMVREGTFISRNILQWSLCGAVYSVLWLVGLGGIFTFTILLLASFGNEIHRWNHMSKTSGFVAFMKDSGLIQIQKQHSLHHKQPHNQYYCVMTSLLNAVLERVNFWRKLEWAIQATTGIAPKRENRRDSKPLKKRKSKAPEVAQYPAAKPSATSAVAVVGKQPVPDNSGSVLYSTQATKNQATKNQATNNQATKKLPLLKVLDDSPKTPVATANVSACSAATKSGCRNCSICKLATGSA